jgi:transcriptional regulator with XRE-family HTH domain
MAQNTLNAEVARNVRAALTQSGVTQAELINTTGIADRTLRRRLQGNSAWTTDELDVISTALKVPVSNLMKVRTHAH